MDAVFGWLFVSTLLSKVILFEILVGNVIVLRKHPQLRECADMALQRNMDVGARISNQTGVCEGLSHDWARNQTIESGYGYAKNVHVRLNYEPPLAVFGDMAIWIIPGVLNTGAKIDIHITTTNFEHSACYPYVCWYSELNKHNVQVTSGNLLYPQFLSHASKQWKISFVAQRNTLYMLVDDEVVLTKNMTVVRLNHLRRVGVSTNIGKESSGPKLSIQSFEFTEASFGKWSPL